MESRRLLAALWLIACMAVSGQTINQPGQVGTGSIAPMSVVPADNLSHSSSSIALTEEQEHDRTANRVWIASLFATAAGTSMDAATSWGRREGNGLLAQSDGTFGAKGVGIKAGVAAATIIPQILLRKHKELRTGLIIGNFVEAGLFMGTAIHNLNVK
jgi:hypothetical protein